MHTELDGETDQNIDVEQCEKAGRLSFPVKLQSVVKHARHRLVAFEQAEANEQLGEYGPRQAACNRDVDAKH